jgi:DNA-binding response OmpR family regulator
VLQLLLEAQGAVVSAEELLEKAWDEMADPVTTTVKATIHRPDRQRDPLQHPRRPDPRPGHHWH